MKYTVKISREVFSKENIEGCTLPEAKERTRKHIHRMLDNWFDKSSYPKLGDSIIFQIAK